MTTITIDRDLLEQALEAMLNFPDDISDAMFESITDLKAALAQKHDPVAHSGWVLREVLFDNGEPIGHREPQHSPAALAQQDEPETCTWHQDGDSDSGVYATSCRHYFNLEDGTPEGNKMQWCCYCGKKLVQELITENDDE